MPLDKKQERLIKIAMKGGNDSSLILADEIDALEAKLAQLEAKIPDIKGLLEAVKGIQGDQGIEGVQGEKGEQGIQVIQGIQGVKGEKGELGIQGIQGEPGLDGKDGEPGKDATAETLSEDLRLSLGDIEKRLEEVSKRPQQRAGWGAHPLVVTDGSTVVDKVTRRINFGTNLTASRSADGIVTVNASGGAGSALTYEAPTGTVDDANLAFTVSNAPLFIIVNGLQYHVGNGIYATYVAGTITLTSPVGTGGYIESYYNA